tara:strand:+ start:1028 stop:1468 length:441 start_codon:yes stop_codon:yes gene_type:complete
MPSLSLSNSSSKAYNRVTTICINNDFSSATSFTGTNATAGVSGNRLDITDSGSGGGYASRSFVTHIGTTYNYSISYISPSTAGHLKLGTSADDGTHVNMAVSSGDPGYGVITGSFTATTKATHITLKITRNGGNQKWDNLTISENN